jgi:hypothetical protein
MMDARVARSMRQQFTRGSSTFFSADFVLWQTNCTSSPSRHVASLAPPSRGKAELRQLRLPL